MTFNVDCDGTIVAYDFPEMGKEIGAARVLKRITDEGHDIILFTMRSDRGDKLYLTDAVNWFKKHNIPLYGIQSNPTQKKWTDSPKSYAQVMIDDSAIGCPLKEDKEISNRPFVDWDRVEQILEELHILKKSPKLET